MIEIISLILGIIFYNIVASKITIIWTSFVILPVAMGCYLLFIGIYIKNDYFFYEMESSETINHEEAKRH